MALRKCQCSVLFQYQGLECYQRIILHSFVTDWLLKWRFSAENKCKNIIFTAFLHDKIQHLAKPVWIPQSCAVQRRYEKYDRRAEGCSPHDAVQRAGLWCNQQNSECKGKPNSDILYDIWERQGLFHVTEGNVVDYNFVRKTINELYEIYNIKELACDRWNATQLITDLEGDGFTIVPMGMGFKEQSPPMKELYKLLLEGKFIHGGNPVLRWMAGNIVAEIDAAENIKPSKKKSTEKIDGIVAWIMALDRCMKSKIQSLL